MTKRISVGDVFGDLTVEADLDRDERLVVWACRCKCGQMTQARSDRLRRGERTHCGCRGQEHVWSSKCLRSAT